MLHRCIMIIPEFEEMQRVDAIRKKYDPLFEVVRPHITLVFPFRSDLTKDDLCTHVSTALSSVSSFPLLMLGFSARREPDGYYIFLDVAEGGEIIRRISGRLYEGVLSKYKSPRYDAAYAPHITIGRFPDEATLQSALAEIGDFPYAFSTTVNSIDVETIGEDGSSSIEMTFRLS